MNAIKERILYPIYGLLYFLSYPLRYAWWYARWQVIPVIAQHAAPHAAPHAEPAQPIDHPDLNPNFVDKVLIAIAMILLFSPVISAILVGLCLLISFITQ
ncbi:MAG: hypothetical protein KIT87_26970 [Anaerolineae bacterium]|nr:hypothetical protein [Anaerolineae bacterium]